MILIKRESLRGNDFLVYKSTELMAKGIMLSEVSLDYHTMVGDKRIIYKGILSPFVKRPSELLLAMIANYTAIYKGGRCFIFDNDEFEIIFYTE